MSKTKDLLKSIEAKEKTIKSVLDNATHTDFSKEGKTEMIEEIESMIDKMEDWKETLREDIPKKKAS